MPFHQQTYKLTGYLYIYAWVEVEHCTGVQCSEGESSLTHLSFAYVVLSASCYTNTFLIFLYYQPVHSAPSCYALVAKHLRMRGRCNDVINDSCLIT